MYDSYRALLGLSYKLQVCAWQLASAWCMGHGGPYKTANNNNQTVMPLLTSRPLEALV